MNECIRKYQEYVWYQDDISLAEHRLVRPSQFGTTEINKLKHPNMIKEKQWKEVGKKLQKKGINTSYA